MHRILSLNSGLLKFIKANRVFGTCKYSTKLIDKEGTYMIKFLFFVKYMLEISYWNFRIK
jgi:hypothetical protein